MRYTIDPRQPHRNLAAGKRSIVLACASIAMVLGTTSVGSSLIVDDTQATNLPNSTIPATPDDAAVQPLSLSPTTKPLGKQQPLILNKPVTKPAGLSLESVPAAAAAVLVQLSKRAAVQTPPTTQTPAATTPSTNTQAASPTTTTTDTTTAGTPPPSGETTPTETPPPSGTTEPPAQTMVEPTSSSADTSSSESL